MALGELVGVVGVGGTRGHGPAMAGAGACPKRARPASQVLGAALLVAYIRVYDALADGLIQVFGALKAATLSVAGHK